jgi:hypothetical protein
MGGPDFRAGGVRVAELAADVAGRLPDDGTRQAIPLALIVAVLQAAVVVLQTCQPTPAGGAAVLRYPGPSPFGLKRRTWTSRIRDAVADGWRGDRAHLAAVQAAVIDRAREGIGPAVVAGLYAEAGQ